MISPIPGNDNSRDGEESRDKAQNVCSCETGFLERDVIQDQYRISDQLVPRGYDIQRAELLFAELNRVFSLTEPTREGRQTQPLANCIAPGHVNSELRKANAIIIRKSRRGSAKNDCNSAP